MANRRYKAPAARKMAPKRGEAARSRSRSRSSKGKHPWLRALVWSVLVVAVVFVGACYLYISWTAVPDCYDEVKHVPATDYGIVLGTGAASGESLYYQARLDAAVELGRAHKVGAMIVSGENCREDFAEVDSMAEYLRRELPDIQILVDSAGVDTYTSIYNAGERYGYDKRYTIVSQRFHCERALWYGRKVLLKAPIAYCAADNATWLWRLRNAVREPMARVKAML